MKQIKWWQLNGPHMNWVMCDQYTNNNGTYRCATVIIALLKTLDNNALYELFNRTKQGELFLNELCSYET